MFFPAMHNNRGGNDSFTKLLLHFNEANGVTTFVDSSASARTISQAGANNVTGSTAQAKFGSTSALWGASTSWLTAPNSADFEFGSGTFTVDWWEYRTANTLGCPAIARDSTTTHVPFIFNYNNDAAGAMVAYASSAGASWDILNAVSMGTATLNTWIHYAVSRDATNIYCFQNGIQKSVTTTSAAFVANSNPLSIGRTQNDTTFPGHMQEMRVSKGICRWVGGTNGTQYFAPPGAPYTKSNQ